MTTSLLELLIAAKNTWGETMMMMNLVLTWKIIMIIAKQSFLYVITTIIRISKNYSYCFSHLIRYGTKMTIILM